MAPAVWASVSALPGSIHVEVAEGRAQYMEADTEEENMAEEGMVLDMEMDMETDMVRGMEVDKEADKGAGKETDKGEGKEADKNADKEADLEEGMVMNKAVLEGDSFFYIDYSKDRSIKRCKDGCQDCQYRS